MIDFGLSVVSNKVEDKAVDLYVLKRDLISSHPGSEILFDKFIAAYKSKFQKACHVVAKFKEVEMRGRKRECFG